MKTDLVLPSFKSIYKVLFLESFKLFFFQKVNHSFLKLKRLSSSTGQTLRRRSLPLGWPVCEFERTGKGWCCYSFETLSPKLWFRRVPVSGKRAWGNWTRLQKRPDAKAPHSYPAVGAEPVPRGPWRGFEDCLAVPSLHRSLFQEVGASFQDAHHQRQKCTYFLVRVKEQSFERNPWFLIRKL